MKMVWVDALFGKIHPAIAPILSPVAFSPLTYWHFR